MATKMTFKGLPAYQEGPFALVKSPDDGLWRVFHIDSGKIAMHDLKGFVQKRDCLAYVMDLLALPFDWKFKDQDDFNKKNVAPLSVLVDSVISRYM